MIHAIRTVTVGDNESIIDKPIVLYRGDREVEIEFTLLGNEFRFSDDGNVIKSANASHGQLVLNTPSGENMFSEVSKCHDGNVVFIITKEMIDEFIEVGFYSFQIRLYDGAEMKSRMTIPPVLNGIDIRNPIAAEDETNVVDQGIVDYARIFKDQSNEELPTFDWTGAYNKTEWMHHDVITENKMNKIEDALYSINANVKESDVVMLNTLDQFKKDTDAYVKEHMAEVEAGVEEFERNLNTGVERFKTDTNATIASHRNAVHGQLASHRNEVYGQLTNFNTTIAAHKNEVNGMLATHSNEVHRQLTNFNTTIDAHKNEVNRILGAHKNEVNAFINQFDTSHISKNGYYTVPGGLLLQWGVLSVNFNGASSCYRKCDFNIPFKNEVFTLFIDANDFGADAGGSDLSVDIYPVVHSKQLNDFYYEIKSISGSIPTGTINCSWLAIGI